MLYLTLNQSCQNLINQEFPDDIMKIIYQYVIALNNKEKINDLFDLFNYDYEYERQTRLKNMNQLKKEYSNTNKKVKNHIIKDIKNSGKKNSMIKEDYIKKICYINHWEKWNDKLINLRSDKIKFYNIETKKGITFQQYTKLKEKFEEDYKNDILKHMEMFKELYPQYNINSSTTIDVRRYDDLAVRNYGRRKVESLYKKCKFRGVMIDYDFDYDKNSKYHYYSSYLSLG